MQLASPFDVNKFAGLWHEHARDKNIKFEQGDCVQAKYTRHSKNKLNVRNNERRNPASTSMDSQGLGYIYTKNDRYPKLLVSFFYIDRSDYQVVETDNTTYAIIRACTDYAFGLLHSELFWIF